MVAVFVNVPYLHCRYGGWRWLMRVSVQKWGNSLALRIPRSMAADSKIKQGSLVEVSVAKGKLVVTPIFQKRSYNLSELLAGVTRRNLHAEVDKGGPTGRESW